MAPIYYLNLFVGILLMMPSAADVSRSGEHYGTGAPEASNGSNPAPITFGDRLDAIEVIIGIGQELLINVTTSVKEDVLNAQKLILRRVEEVEDKLTEKCRLDAHYKSNDETTNLKVPVYKDCQAWADAGYNTSGVYTISLDGVNEIDVYCAASTCGYGTGWTVFQMRFNGSVDFNRNWADYSQGFGDMHGEFWLGLDLLHTLTANGTMQLLVELENDNLTACAHYSNFSVGDLSSNYTLYVSNFTNGLKNPGDSLSYHNGMSFSTPDNDNDRNSGNCAAGYNSAWWYNACTECDLNGIYGGSDYYWVHWSSHNYNIDASKMMVKPK